jgi:putative YhbY family RNA-binding protein
MPAREVTDMLSAKERKGLRARAHGLKPVVWVAESGMTPGALKEIDRALAAHELIKIRAELSGRAAREALLGDICAALGAQPVQVIGKMLIAFRHRPEPPPALSEKPQPAAKPRKRAGRATGGRRTRT